MNKRELLLSEPAAPPPSSSLPEASPTPTPYVKRFNVFQRLYRLLFSPAEAMQDIASAPDYQGGLTIILIQTMLMGIVVASIFQKIHFTGSISGVSLAGAVFFFAFFILVLALIVSVAMLVGLWFLEALFVKLLGDSGSGWSFRVAASVAGYAYIAYFVSGLIPLVGSWLLMPEVTIDLTNPALSRAVIQEIGLPSWFSLVSWVFAVLGLVWVSYLGGLGVHFGTKKRCSIRKGMAVFLGLGLIPVLISSFSLLWYLFV